MQVDICVLTAGGREDLLNKCLAAIKSEIDANSNSHRFKVYYYDNGSPDVQIFRENSRLNWITAAKRSTKNKGFPFGANRVIWMGYSDIVLFVTDDVVLQPGFIQTALKKMVSDRLIGVQGFKLLFPKDSESPIRPAGKVQHVGHAFTLRGECVHPLVGWSSDNPKCCVSRELQSVTGAVMMIRRDVFNRVGGFDEIYGLGTYEDADLCMKVSSQGYKIWFNADCIAEHYTGATAEKLNLPFPINRNKLIFNERWTARGVVEWDDWTWY